MWRAFKHFSLTLQYLERVHAVQGAQTSVWWKRVSYWWREISLQAVTWELRQKRDFLCSSTVKLLNMLNGSADTACLETIPLIPLLQRTMGRNFRKIFVNRWFLQILLQRNYIIITWEHFWRHTLVILSQVIDVKKNYLSTCYEDIVTWMV
jgi:hypothetical protein